MTLLVAHLLAIATGHAAINSFGEDELGRKRDPLNESIHGPLTNRGQQIPKLIFFPPNPPPLGTLIDLSEQEAVVTGAPAALAPFVMEPFYAPLSTFISPVVTAYQGTEGLNENDRVLLDNFRRLRARLREELRKEISALETSPAVTRERAFADLARRQARHLVELERLAESLRARLARRADWSELRQWRLAGDDGVARYGTAGWFDLRVIRAAAFYQDGLAPAQRRLLRELVMEVEERLFGEPGGQAGTRSMVFFQPETSRVPLPRPWPPAVAGTIQHFLTLKETLKEELGRAVRRHDDQLLEGARAAAFRKLAERQAPQLAELETLAEEIRVGLAAAPHFARTTRPDPLPRALVEEIEAARRDYRDLWRTSTSPDPAAVRTMEQRLTTLHRRLELATQSEIDRPNVAEADAFLVKFLDGHRRAGAYHEYDIAVFEPGLSPEQRRLLYSAAIEALELPLPGPEAQPTTPLR